MKTRTTVRRVGAIAGTSLLALAVLGPAASPALAKPGSGAIWTTNETCETPAAQNANQYAPGDHVYLRGSGFEVDTAFGWTISGLPGGASGDPGAEVWTGDSVTGPDGSFCVDAYTIAADDWGTYTVDVEQGDTSKNDNYRVAGPADQPPADQPPADEPPADQPPADEPPADEPPVDAPPADEPPADEPPADEPPADEPEDAPVQDVLGATSDTTVTPPPTDLATSDTTSGGSDWRIALTVLGILAMVAALSTSDRTRRGRG